MLTEIKQFIRKAANGAKLWTWPNRYRMADWDSRETSAGIFVTAENSLQCSAAAACVRLLSETMASLPLHVYRDIGSSKAIASDHPQYELLHSRPNDYMTSWAWIQLAMTDCLLHGNFFAFIDRNASGDVAAMWPLKPQGVIVEAIDGQIFYRYAYGGQRSVFEYRDVLHLKGLTLDGLVGMSVLQMARQGIGLSMAQEGHAASLFRNQARLGMVIEHPGMISKEAQVRLRDSFNERYAGARNAGKTLVLEEGMKAMTLGMSNVDAEFLKSREFSAIEIARWFRVPPTMIGDMSRVSYSSSESELQIFAMHSLVPWCSNFEAEFNHKLLPERTQYFHKFDVNSIVRGDLASRYAAYGQGLQAGFLTVSDVRGWENLPFIAGTDQLMRPAQMMPQGGQNENAKPGA